MSIVTLSNIEKTFGKRVLFDKLTLAIEAGERIGLIGANGAGKTSLFKVLVGEVVPDTGTVSVAKGTRVGYLTQDPSFDPANDVMDEAELAFSQLHMLSHKLREQEHAMGAMEGEALEKILSQYQDTQHEFELAGGYAWRHKLEATLLGVGLGREVWEQNVATLSGGQRSRLALAKLLIASPELLLLDEPTNHLDLAAVEWLEQYLLNFSGAVLLVSHDRYLLDRLATRIAYLSQSRIQSYKGNYSAFVEQREVQELTQARQFEEQQADIAKQQEFIRRFGAGQRSKEAKGRQKRLERLLKSDQVVGRVEAASKINLSLDTERRAGDRVLAVRELSKSYGEKELWQEIGFQVARGERIGIIGPNGSGKTTLLETLLGRNDADAGEIKWGANLEVGYYDQRLDDLDPDSTVLDEASAGHEGRGQEVRDSLGAMLFRGEDVYKEVRLLSGGERARVRLVQLLLDKPNVLLLDEPTNHLDIASCEALESTLASFPGTILCVSHDRYFLNKVTSRLLVLDPPRLDDFAGTYSAWATRQTSKPASKAAEAPKQKAAPPPSRPRGAAPDRKSDKKKDNPYSRPFGRLSSKQLEREITETEVALADCQESLAASKTFRDPSRGQQLQAEYKVLAKKLEGLEAEYFAREE